MAGFQYKQLPEGVHELTISSASDATLDECFSRLNAVFFETDLNQPILLLSDIRRCGVPPLAHLWSLSRKLLHNHPHQSLICNAVVHNLDSHIFNTFSLLMQQLAGIRRAPLKFFRGDAHDEAVQWLLDEGMKAGYNTPEVSQNHFDNYRGN